MWRRPADQTSQKRQRTTHAHTHAHGSRGIAALSERVSRCIRCPATSRCPAMAGLQPSRPLLSAAGHMSLQQHSTCRSAGGKWRARTRDLGGGWHGGKRALGCVCCRYWPRERWLVLMGSGGISMAGFAASVPKDSSGKNDLLVLNVEGVKMRGALL